MATCLVWRHITQEQINEVRNPHPKRNLTSRDLLAKAVGVTRDGSAQNEITLDLYTRALQFGQGLGFNDEQLSGLLGIVVNTHVPATAGRLPVVASFTGFKELLMKHSVQRPPWSMGLFTYRQMQAVLQWMLDTYYKHYKLYQYAFTNRVTMTVETSHPSQAVEVPPAIPPLQDAITEEEHQHTQDLLQQEADALQKAAADSEAAAAEASRVARLRQEYESAIPDEIKEKVQAVVDRELEVMRAAMDASLKEQEARFALQLTSLQLAAKPRTPNK